MFNTQIPIYGLVVLIALLSNLIVVLTLSKKYNYTKNEIIDEYVGIISGAKILSYFQNYSKYNGEFNVMQLGLSSYGAVIGVILFLRLCTDFQKQYLVIFLCFRVRLFKQ